MTRTRRPLPRPDPDKPCLTTIGNLRVARDPERSPVVSGQFAPWDVQISARFSKGPAPGPFARAQYNYAAIGHMQLLRLAADANMTPRAFVLLALKDRGLDVKDDHLLDLRKARTK